VIEKIKFKIKNISIRSLLIFLSLLSVFAITIVDPFWKSGESENRQPAITEIPEIYSHELCKLISKDDNNNIEIGNFNHAQSIGQCRTVENYCKNTAPNGGGEDKRKCDAMGWYN